MDFITKNQLAEDLRQIGLEKGDTVYVHSSLKSIGLTIEGGPEALVGAFLDVLGKSGTLAVPTHTLSFIGLERPPYDKNETPGIVGLFPETVRKHPQARRSNHPTHSSAAIGAKAEWLTEDHNLSDAFHMDSPLYKLYTGQSKVLLLGVRHTSNTSLHLAEWLADLPYIRTQYIPSCVEAHYVRDGQVRIAEQVRFPGCSGSFELINGMLQLEGITCEKTIGQAKSQLIDMRPMVDLAVEVLRKRQDFFLCRYGTCRSCTRRRQYLEELQ